VLLSYDVLAEVGFRNATLLLLPMQHPTQEECPADTEANSEHC